MTLLQLIGRLLRKLWVSGVRLRCPNCEQGQMFNGLLRPKLHCEVCRVRFERMAGESIGGLAISAFVVPSVALVGFFLTDVLTDLPFTLNAIIWGTGIIVGSTFLYRHARAAWVAVSYLTGGVYADETPPEEPSPPADTSAQREQMVAAFRQSRPTSRDDVPSNEDKLG